MYNNRLNGCCKPCPPKEDKPKKEEPAVEEMKAPSCKLFKATSIVKVKDKVIITFDDCTFISEDFSIVDESVSSGIDENISAKLQEIDNLKAELEKMKESTKDSSEVSLEETDDNITLTVGEKSVVISKHKGTIEFIDVGGNRLAFGHESETM